MRLFVIWLVIIGTFRASGEACTFDAHNSLGSQLNLLRQIVKVPSNDSLDIFKRALQCRDRIWTAGASGTRKIFFVDRASLTGCEFQPESLHCTPLQTETLQDPTLRNELVDLAGYAVFPGGSGRIETLILNKSPQDIVSRIESVSTSIVQKSKVNVLKCRPMTSARTVGIQSLSLPQSENDLAGFFMHEDFHFYQRKWKQQIRTSAPPIVLTAKLYTLWERVTFYLSRFARGNSVEKINALAHAKFYYLELKKLSPVLAESLSNRDEGTAAFVEARAGVLASESCEIAESELRRLTGEKLTAMAEQHLSVGEPSPYVLGALASHAMELLGRSNWKKDVENSGLTPVELLFEKVEAVPPASLESPSEALAECLTGGR